MADDRMDDARGTAPDDATEVVFTANSVPEAELVMGRIESAGIEAFIEVRDGGGQFPNLDPLVGVQVLVRATDLGRANEALAEAEPLAEDEDPPTQA